MIRVLLGLLLAEFVSADGHLTVSGLFPFTSLHWNNQTEVDVTDASPVYLNNNLFERAGKLSNEVPPGFSYLAAFLMALEHFNTRNPVVVPELADASFENCSVRFEIDNVVVLDTESSASSAVSALLGQVYEQKIPNLVIGGDQESTALDLSVVTSGLRMPLVAYGGINRRVVSLFYPFSTRTSPDVDLISRRISSYLKHRGRENYWALFASSSDTGIQLKEMTAFRAQEEGISLIFRTFFPTSEGSNESEIFNGLRSLRDTGYRTVILACENPIQEIPVVAKAANSLGMNDGTYFWLIVGAFSMSIFEMDFVQGSAITRKFLRGAAVIRELEGFFYAPDDNRFLASWRQQNPSLIATLNDKNPVDPSHGQYAYANDNFFQINTPAAGSGFVYDAVIASGIGFCRASSNQTASRVQAIQEAMFQGASGFVTFGGDHKYPGGRTSHTVTFGAFNLFPRGVTDGLSFVLTDVIKGTEIGAQDMTWKSLRTFYYADGSPRSPMPLRDPPEQNYLDPIARIVGFTLYAIAVLLILAGVVWVKVYSKHPLVRASQPIFLYMISFGSLLVSCAIITNSFDESHGWTTEELGRACTATPWVIFLGDIINYGALFSKLWRVNKVLQFRRSMVKIQHVVWPMVLLIVIAIVLLTIWTIFGGFHWTRVEIDPVTGESIGKCQGEDSTLYFTPIFVLSVVPTLLALAMALKTRDIEATYSESNWIFVLILVQLQVLVVSIPVLRILENENATGRYVGQIMIFWTFAVSPTSLVIGPKVYAVHIRKERMPSQRGGPSGRLFISGLNPSPPGGIGLRLGSKLSDESRSKQTAIIEEELNGSSRMLQESSCEVTPGASP